VEFSGVHPLRNVSIRSQATHSQWLSKNAEFQTLGQFRKITTSTTTRFRPNSATSGSLPEQWLPICMRQTYCMLPPMGT
jgi:hypothetical protein